MSQAAACGAPPQEGDGREPRDPSRGVDWLQSPGSLQPGHAQSWRSHHCCCVDVMVKVSWWYHGGFVYHSVLMIMCVNYEEGGMLMSSGNKLHCAKWSWFIIAAVLLSWWRYHDHGLMYNGLVYSTVLVIMCLKCDECTHDHDALYHMSPTVCLIESCHAMCAYGIAISSIGVLWDCHSHCGLWWCGMWHQHSDVYCYLAMTSVLDFLWYLCVECIHAMQPGSDISPPPSSEAGSSLLSWGLIASLWFPTRVACYQLFRIIIFTYLSWWVLRAHCLEKHVTLMVVLYLSTWVAW